MAWLQGMVKECGGPRHPPGDVDSLHFPFTPQGRRRRVISDTETEEEEGQREEEQGTQGTRAVEVSKGVGVRQRPRVGRRLAPADDGGVCRTPASAGGRRQPPLPHPTNLPQVISDREDELRSDTDTEEEERAAKRRAMLPRAKAKVRSSRAGLGYMDGTGRCHGVLGRPAGSISVHEQWTASFHIRARSPSAALAASSATRGPPRCVTFFISSVDHAQSITASA